MNPMFSVIVPIYKVEAYLNKCIDSIINQKFNNFELILVDDGSPDKCSQICDEYKKKDNRIRVIHKKNGGLVSARKAGCKIANGDYIVNVDGDDWLVEGFFSTLEKIINKCKPDIICFGAIYVGKEKKLNNVKFFDEGLYIKDDIQKRVYPMLIERDDGIYFQPSVWSKVCKRELYQHFQQSVDDKISIGEDMACTKPMIYNANSMYVIKECLYCYRLNQNSMTRNKKAFDLEVPKLISKHFENNVNMKEYDFQNQVYRALVHNLFNAAVSQFNKNKSFAVIKKEIIDVLEDEYNKKAIEKCKYNKKYLKGNVAKIILKYRMIWAMKIINKLQKKY